MSAPFPFFFVSPLKLPSCVKVLFFRLCLLDEVDFLCTRGKTRQDMRLGSSGVSSQGASHDALLAIALAATHPQSKLIAVGEGAVRFALFLSLFFSLTSGLRVDCGCIAISNSIELSTHLSGLKVRSLAVAPYTEEEILAIIDRKLEAAAESLNITRAKAGRPLLSLVSLKNKVFAPGALLLFARKAANSNGDVRMALSGLR